MHNSLQFHLLFPGIDVAFLHIAKNASTNIKRAIMEEMSKSYGYEFPDFNLNPNIVHKAASQFEVKNLDELQDYYVVAVIRNPVERIYSAFANKYIQKSNLDYTLNFSGCSNVEDMLDNFSFESFCYKIFDSDPLTLNGHWIPQHLNFIKGQSYQVFNFDSILTSDSLSKTIKSNLFSKSVDAGSANSVNYSSKVDQYCGDLSLKSLKEKYDKKKLVPNIESMISPDMNKKILDYYNEDNKLHQQAIDNLKITW